MTIRAEPPPGAVVLRVDATVHAAEVARFTRFVVRRPGRRDCWLWVGAIADGYGHQLDPGRGTTHPVRAPVRVAPGRRHRGCLPTNIDPRGRHGRAHAIRAALTGGYDPLRLAAARTYSLTPTVPLFDLSTR